MHDEHSWSWHPSCDDDSVKINYEREHLTTTARACESFKDLVNRAIEELKGPEVGQLLGMKCKSEDIDPLPPSSQNFATIVSEKHTVTTVFYLVGLYYRNIPDIVSLYPSIDFVLCSYPG